MRPTMSVASLPVGDLVDVVASDFAPILSLFFRDPDGLEGEVVVANPDAPPWIHPQPGTPAPRFVVKEEEPNP